MSGNISKVDIEDIYNRHVDTVYKVCFMFMKNKSETEDAVQSTFIKLMDANVSFNDEAHEKAWLIVTASNICKNNLKHWFRNRRSNYDDYSHLLQHKDSYDFEILEDILSLPAKYKTVIYLYYYEGYSSPEISKILNIKESTIRSHLSRGRQMLKTNLGG